MVIFKVGLKSIKQKKKELNYATHHILNIVRIHFISFMGKSTFPDFLTMWSYNV